ncbi:hypothetical protein AGJ34_14345 [Cronobacter dublinensis subsp. dublinensis]|nr:hypothetical protein [Cronobacter dublinensis subsp. dublinensis]EGT5670718.1 hypothetical protein [Cronobacter dublinensis subsp. dublinensis]EGT5674172.1 hypothetical protein [Cronobacter dublinensis subsp. dublinensis]EGT5678712.1 hypothetical protein [Cronobacter dublinensis subsp. dublinensis]EGT5686817.1 hypothetical protein [Cronobacter dublinensis subsp. dublinensis]
MELTEKYAVWYSTCSDYNLIQDYFNKGDGLSKFEKDFDLKNRFIDYDHAVSIWYGKEHGELGEVSTDNPAIDGFQFITAPVADKLYSLGVGEISYIFAIPDLEYNKPDDKVSVMKFLDNVVSSQNSSSWLDDILNDM